MSEDERREGDGERATDRRPYRVRLPEFVKGEDVGLGDVVKHATYAVGVRACGSCERRATALNRWVVFSPLAWRVGP